MSWITIGISDLKDIRVAQWIEVLRTTALELDQDEPTEEIVENAVARVRSEIGAYGGHRMDSNTTTVPVELRDVTCRLAIRQMQARLCVEPTESEERQNEQDIQFLQRIARGEVKLSLPSGAVAEPLVSVSDALRLAMLKSQEGL